MKAVSAQVVSCCVYVKPSKIMQPSMASFRAVGRSSCLSPSTDELHGSPVQHLPSASQPSFRSISRPPPASACWWCRSRWSEARTITSCCRLVFWRFRFRLMVDVVTGGSRVKFWNLEKWILKIFTIFWMLNRVFNKNGFLCSGDFTWISWPLL